MLGWSNRAMPAEAPPEITRVRIESYPAACLAPQFLADELLRLEGFSQVEYVTEPQNDADLHPLLVEGKLDFYLDAATGIIPDLDDGRPIVVLSGIHGGCWELFGSSSVRTIRDLKGKRIAVIAKRSAEQVYVASMLAYVGIDPRKDVTWVETKSFDGMVRVFIEGKADAVLGFPPQPQELRAKKIGHVIVNTSQDLPWSQYFCCMLVGHRDFVRKYPVATKRAVRAIVKAMDICAREPERAARFMVDKGYEKNYDIALEVVKGVSYKAWRVLDPNDTLRFYLLRLREVGMLKSSPQKLLAEGTDWRFLNELKRELKA
jgi:NitT/TauT family transport system substrate-binding protein